MTPNSPENWRDLVAGTRADAARVVRLRESGGIPPAEAGEAAEELALNALLEAHRPAPAVSSNFTARVLAEIDREGVRADRAAAEAPWWRRFRWVPRLAVAAALVVAATMLWSRNRAEHQQQLAATALEVGNASAIPGLETRFLADFEVIRNLAAEPSAEDDALILALAQ